MLFRQYTRESINEARMLYVLAYDLLGKKPENMGTLKLSEDRNYEQLTHFHEESNDDYDFLLLEMENGQAITEAQSLSTGTTFHCQPYFYIPENKLFMDYWNRVEDRLFKIRNSLNIMGEKQPLPLFQPPIDPMALVNAVASGGSISAALADMNAAVPHYRFNYMLEKAKAYADKVAQFGGDLLGAIEKKDAEDLEILHNKQEAGILQMNTQIKKDQIGDAKANIKSLEQSLKSAEEQYSHYDRLIKEGLIDHEETQIDMLIASTVLMGTAGVLKIAGSILYGLPEVHIGPFIAGSSVGGRNWGMP